MKLTIHEAASFMGIQLTISSDDLKIRYKELVKIYHPDISKEQDAEEKMKKLNASFDLLKDKVPVNGRSTSIPLDEFEFDISDIMKQYQYGKFSSSSDFFDKFFEKQYKDGFFGGGRNAGKTQQPKPPGPEWQVDKGQWNKRKGMITVFIKIDTSGQFFIQQVIGINLGPPVSFTMPEMFDTAQRAKDFADINIFKDKQPPQPKKTSDWKRAGSGNMWMRKNGITFIVFSKKLNYMFMTIDQSDQKKYYNHRVFQTEEAAMIFIDNTKWEDL